MAVHAPRIQVPHPHENRPGSSRWLALAVLCVSLLVVSLDSTILNIALPALVRSLGATESAAAVDRRRLRRGLRRIPAGGRQHRQTATAASAVRPGWPSSAPARRRRPFRARSPGWWPPGR